ncbi:MAG: SCO1664 family protein [Chloroflexota bacterium]
MALHGEYPAARIADGPHQITPDTPDAAAFLRSARMADGWLHPEGSNYTFVVELECDGRSGFGVYKPQRGEAPLWDFSAGTLYRRECAAWELSNLLGWGLVPPTLEREGEAGVGSLQLFVPAQDDSNYFTLREAHPERALALAVFDVLANNADRKGGHVFVGRAGGVWAIDNGLTFNTEPKLRTVVWDFAGQQVPAALLQDVERALAGLDGEAGGPLRALLSPDELAALGERMVRLLAAPVLPSPQSRRDLPWPWL